jgi:hypothetical protein
MPTLNQLFSKHQTDKFSHTFQNESYLDVYERYFSSLQNKPVNVLELGVLNGNSIHLFEEYFPNGTIYAIDIDPACKRFETDRVKIWTCSQDDELTINAFLGDKQFDIIIDDASHINSLTIAAFNILWSRIKSGGLYCIEDLEPIYYKDIGKHAKSWPGMKYNSPSLEYVNDETTMHNFWNNIIKELNFKRGDVRDIHFHYQMVFFRKV